ncbi:DUF1837 domain-containing protein [Fulvivirgaceae bacterium PWU4]|uniref:DUF1837 domain-containing protein n=1 Tax=Chryseosolibacter histidini TaxID=2782349 RepID=A0AAP2DGR4_9BACT|nr:DUF1837 domain-containing protein [Chryseosolibacter histidini]MBT1696076.1 DUF1837 domain-containing protein [Chryseosolibacter histidini]
MISENDFQSLLRGNAGELKTYLQDIELSFKLDETLAVTNCHSLRINANGQVRFNDFARYLASKIVDFAIPRSEIQKAFEFYNTTGSTSKIVELNNKATQLFSSLKKSGEGGEILLYLLIEDILKVPQILCKMSLKTSSEMHVHGCDGIHANYDETDDILSLYWGESKLYKDIGSALTNCFNSLKGFLLDNGGSSGSQERDIQLVRSYIDLKDEKIEDAIVKYLDKDNEKFNKVKYKGACLIGFDYEDYPKAANSGVNDATLKEKIEKVIIDWKVDAKKKIKAIETLDTFELHLFLIPFPSVQSFRDAFLIELGIKK